MFHSFLASTFRVVPEPCPICGAYVVAKSKRGVLTFLCSADKEHDTSSMGGQSGERELEEAEV